MAIEMNKSYWIYQIIIGEEELAELDEYAHSGKAEYVAGYLIGKLKSHGKLIVPKEEEKLK